MIRKDQSGFQLKLWFTRNEIPFDIKVLKSSSGKKVQQNEKIIKLESEYINQVFSLVFSPDILSAYKTQPIFRRRFFDRIFSMVDESYMELLKKFKNAQSQKNALLKNKSKNEAELDAWNSVLSPIIFQITKKRAELIDKINSCWNERIKLSDVKLKYESIFNSFLEKNIEDIEVFLRGKKDREVQVGYMLYGNHRDDFTYISDGKDNHNYLSQGEYRKIFLNQIFAVNKFFISEKNFHPLILFDDALSELDKDNTEDLLRKVSEIDNQIFFTNVNPLANKVDKLSVYNVDGCSIIHL